MYRVFRPWRRQLRPGCMPLVPWVAAGAFAQGWGTGELSACMRGQPLPPGEALASRLGLQQHGEEAV